MNLTLVTANQWVGFWFLVLIISCTPKGELILIDAFDSYYKNIKVEASIKISDITSKYGNINSKDNCETPTQHFDFSQLIYLKHITKQESPSMEKIINVIEKMLIYHSACHKKNFFGQ